MGRRFPGKRRLQHQVQTSPLRTGSIKDCGCGLQRRAVGIHIGARHLFGGHREEPLRHDRRSDRRIRRLAIFLGIANRVRLRVNGRMRNERISGGGVENDGYIRRQQLGWSCRSWRRRRKNVVWDAASNKSIMDPAGEQRSLKGTGAALDEVSDDWVRGKAMSGWVHGRVLE